MDNLEDVLSELNRFNATKEVSSVPTVLNDYLQHVARCGQVQFAWPRLKPLVKYKLDCVMDSYGGGGGGGTVGVDGGMGGGGGGALGQHFQPPAMPNVEPFNFGELRTDIHLTIDNLSGTPFTIQRLCELITEPMRYYKRVDKYMRAVEKCVRVVTALEELKSGERNESVLNGDQSADADMLVVSSSLSPSLEQPPPPTAGLNGPATGDADVATSSGADDVVTQTDTSQSRQLPGVESVRDALSVAQQEQHDNADVSGNAATSSAINGQMPTALTSLSDCADAAEPVAMETLVGTSGGDQLQHTDSHTPSPPPSPVQCVDMDMESVDVPHTTLTVSSPPLSASSTLTTSPSRSSLCSADGVLLCEQQQPPSQPHAGVFVDASAGTSASAAAVAVSGSDDNAGSSEFVGAGERDDNDMSLDDSLCGDTDETAASAAAGRHLTHGSRTVSGDLRSVPSAQTSTDVTADCTDVTAESADCTDVTAESADCTDVTAESADCTDVTTESADCSDVTAESDDCTDVTAESADCTDVTAESADCTDVTAKSADCSDVTTESADCTDVKAGSADCSDVTAESADCTDVTAESADCSDVTAESASVCPDESRVDSTA